MPLWFGHENKPRLFYVSSFPWMITTTNKTLSRSIQFKRIDTTPLWFRVPIYSEIFTTKSAWEYEWAPCCFLEGCFLYLWFLSVYRFGHQASWNTHECNAPGEGNHRGIGAWTILRNINPWGFHAMGNSLGLPPTQDASGKWRFSSGSPIKNIIFLVVTVTGRGVHPRNSSKNHPQKHPDWNLKKGPKRRRKNIDPKALNSFQVPAASFPGYLFRTCKKGNNKTHHAIGLTSLRIRPFRENNKKQSGDKKRQTNLYFTTLIFAVQTGLSRLLMAPNCCLAWFFFNFQEGQKNQTAILGQI